MKRFVCILFALCLCLTLGLQAMAAPYADISVLFEVWEQSGYPDDVAGVYSTDGSEDHLTVLLIGDEDGSREAEIRAMLNDDSEASFAPGTFSRNRLQEINEEISEGYIFEGTGVYACGIGWGENGGFGENGDEIRVVVTVDESRFEEFTNTFAAVYGDAVVVEAGSPPVLTPEENMAPAPENDIHSDLSEEPAEQETRGWVALIIAPIALLAVAACLFLLRKKKK